MTENVAGAISLRDLREDDLPTMFEIQRDDTAQYMAAFIDEKTAHDRDAYVRKFQNILADDAIVTKVVEIGGEIVGSVAAFPIEGDTEVTYWIRRDWWGRGVATAALAGLLAEVTVRPIYGRVAEDNLGSVRVVERNGFVLVGREEAFASARQATITELVYKLS